MAVASAPSWLQLSIFAHVGETVLKGLALIPLSADAENRGDLCQNYA
jgi:hypothetical protein